MATDRSKANYLWMGAGGQVDGWIGGGSESASPEKTCNTKEDDNMIKLVIYYTTNKSLYDYHTRNADDGNIDHCNYITKLTPDVWVKLQEMSCTVHRQISKPLVYDKNKKNIMVSSCMICLRSRINKIKTYSLTHVCRFILAFMKCNTPPCTLVTKHALLATT